MATERLRKRLKSSQHHSTDGGAGPSSSSRSHENFCLVGTPLPSLGSSKRDANEFKPVWQQEVYDEQGRQRFHGAFTGGWSAGYFNTVGSKEGWAPSSFRSSRSDREQGGAARDKVAAQSVEDFMDEEDKSDFRQGRGALKTNDAYSAAHQRPNERRGEADPLMGLLGFEEPASSLHLHKSTVGFQILRRMGWQDGQGLGSNMALEHKKSLCAMLGLPSQVKDNEEQAKGLVPPPDTPLLLPKTLQRKDRQGLGWSNSDQPATLADILQTQRQSKDAAELHRAGLGNIEYPSRAQRAPDNQGSILLGRGNGSSRIGSGSKEDNRWHDGSPMIAGFRISQESPPLEKWYAATAVPVGWKPDPQRVWSDSAAPLEKYRLTETRSKHTSNPSERAAVLGEARAPGPPPAISDYISIKDRERLRRIKEAASSDDHSAVQAAEHEGPKLNMHQAQNALQGYIPFSNDPSKQQRYRTYLQSQANPDGDIVLKPSHGQTYDQFRHELDEFAKSALIFKPMSTMMANRFESSSTTSAKDADDQPRPGLYIPPRKEEKERLSQMAGDAERVSEEEKDRQNEGEMTSMQRNARMGLFGPSTTREVLVWKPARLLCKRFNVPPPYREEDDANGAGNEGASDARRTEEAYDEFGSSLGRRKIVANVNSRWETSKRQLQQAAASRAWEFNGTEHGKLSHGAPKEERAEVRIEDRTEHAFDLGQVGLGQLNDEGEETAYVKPPTELFKAIFADEEEDERRLPSQDDVVAAESSADAPLEKGDEATRLRFVPRPRRADLSDDPAARADQNLSDLSGRPSSAQAAATPKKKSKRDQKRGTSRLSFRMDDEDDVGDASVDSQSKTKERSSTKSRPLASDLFDV